MTEKNDYENILKLLPEPDVYQMPSDYLDRQMMQMWPRMVILDRFTWVAKQNVLIYRWAKACRPYLTGNTNDIPNPPLSSILRPSRNRYENSVMALADTLGKFRPGEVPIDLAEDMIYSTHGVINIIKDINTNSAIIACEEAFDAFVRLWNYQGSSRISQPEFINKLKEKATDFVKSLNPVWLGIYELERRLLGEAKNVQLTLEDMQNSSDEILTGMDVVRKHLDKTTDTIRQSLGKSHSTLQSIIYNAKYAILKAISEEGLSTKGIKDAMVDLAVNTTKEKPEIEPREIWRKIYDAYVSIPGAYSKFEAFRKQVERRLRHLAK